MSPNDSAAGLAFLSCERTQARDGLDSLYSLGHEYLVNLIRALRRFVDRRRADVGFCWWHAPDGVHGGAAASALRDDAQQLTGSADLLWRQTVGRHRSSTWPTCWPDVAAGHWRSV